MNIIELAKQSGFFVEDGEAYSPSIQADHELTRFLEHFAALVAAQEREACAKIAEIAEPYQCSDLIRARGTT